MSNTLEVIETIFENDLERILRCRDNKTGETFINNIIFNQNLIKLVNIDVLNKLNSNIVSAYEDSERLYIISKDPEKLDQKSIREYVKQGLTLKEQFCLSEQLIELFISIFSCSDLLQFKILNEDNLTVDAHCNLKVNGTFKFSNEFDISDNFTFKNFGNLVHYIFSEEEIVDYNISDKVPPDISGIIVSSLVREYAEPKEIMKDFRNTPIYKMINCDGNKYDTIHNKKIHIDDEIDSEEVDDSEIIEVKDDDGNKNVAGIAVGAAVGVASSMIINSDGEDNVITDSGEKDLNNIVDENTDGEIKNIENTEFVSNAENIVKADNLDNTENTENTENIESTESIVDATDAAVIANMGNIVDVDNLENTENVENIADAENSEDNDYVEDINKHDSENFVSEGADTLEEIESEDNIDSEEDNVDYYLEEIDDETSKNAAVLGGATLAKTGNDEKDIEKENIFDDENIQKDKSSKSGNILIPIIVILLVLLASICILKSLYSDKDDEITDDDNAVITEETNDKTNEDENVDNSTDETDEITDDTGEENTEPDKTKFSSTFDENAIEDLSYEGVLASYEVKDGETYLVAKNEGEKRNSVLFSFIDFTGENSYMHDRQIEIIVDMLANDDCTAGLNVVLGSGEENNTKCCSIELLDNIWVKKTVTLDVNDFDNVTLYLELEPGQEIWIKTITLNMAK